MSGYVVVSFKQQLQKKWITRISELCIFFCNICKLYSPWSHKESVLLLIFTTLKLIMSFNMSITHSIINIIDQFISPNRRGIQYRFFPIECITVDVIFVTSFLCRCTKLSRSKAPAPHIFRSHMKQNHFSRIIRLKQSWV